MTATPPPPGWSFASQDLNIFLYGQVVAKGEGDGVEGAHFKLASNGIRITHPSLISITSTPKSHTLHSVNLVKPIFSLPLSPSSSQSPNRAPQHDDGDERKTSPTATEGTIITLHAPLLVPADYEQAMASPYYSTNFGIVLDGDEPGTFLSPKFDLAQFILPSPKTNANYMSPSIQRALLSPLLSPQRRAASAGSDISVPPLSLGLSRQPPTRIQPASGLSSLLPSASNSPTLQQVLSNSLSAKSKEMTDELVLLRHKQETFTKRIKAEFDLLESRISNFGVGVSPSGGRTRLVKGFNLPGSSSEREPPVSGSGRDKSVEGRRETSLEREASNSIRSPERGRTRRPSITTRKDGSQELITEDEKLSEKIIEEDRKEEESRGRSRSRARRSSKQQQQEVAEGEMRPGREIMATTEDEVDVEGKAVPELIPEKAKEGVGGGEDEEEQFVPSSHHLVTITEAEEEAAALESGTVGEEVEVEASINGRQEKSKTPEKSKERKKVVVVEEEEEHEEEEGDTPFDMDEDIDSSSHPAPEPVPVEEEPAPPLPTTALAPPASSFRPGSYRSPSTLSSSYANLLSSTMAKSPKPPPIPASSAYFSPPPSSLFSPKTTPIPGPAYQKAGEIVSSSLIPEPDIEDYSLHPTQPDPAEEGRDALKNFIHNPVPDEKAAKVGARQIRDVLAMDAPSHRAPLPVKRLGSGRGKEREESEDEDESAGGGDDTDVPDKFRVGSLPVQMHASTHRNARRPSSDFRPEPERELERKTSVPSRREGMFVHPLPRGQGTPKKVTSPPPYSLASPSTISISRSPIPTTASILTGPSSLAQSLQNRPTQNSFSQMAGRGDPDVAEQRKRQEEEKGFVPPHMYANKNQKMEDVLGRSVHDY